MRFMLVLFMLSASVAAAELKPLPPRGQAFDGAVWKEYSMETLREVFPDHEETVRQFQFIFVDVDVPNVSTMKNGDHWLIWVTNPALDLLETPAEYAFLLGHELGHIVKGHSFNNSLWVIRALEGNPYIWLNVTNEEIEADMFSALNVPGGVCTAADISERILPHMIIKPHPRKTWHVRQRVRLLRSWCEFAHVEEERATEKKEKP